MDMLRPGPVRPLPMMTPVSEQKPDEINGLDLLFGPDPSARVEPVSEPEINGLDLLFGGDPAAAVPPPTAKDLTYDPDKTLGFLGEAKGSFASDETEWTRAAAQTLYPDEPLEAAVKRFGKTKDGRFFHRGDDGQMYEVRPPDDTWASWGQGIGAGVGPAVPAATGLLTGIATMPLTGPGSLPAAGAGAAAGEMGRQFIGDMILGEASTKAPNTDQLIKEFLLGATGQGVGIGMGRWMQRFNVPDIDMLSRVTADQLYDIAEREGIRLTPAEATNLQSLIHEQKRMMSLPAPSNTMRQFYGDRDQEVAQAWRRFLDNVSPAQDAGRVGENSRTIAQNIVEGLQQQRTAAVNPLYDDLERTTGFANPQGVVQWLEAQLPTAKGSERKALQYVQSQLRTTEGDATDASFRGLDGAKKAIDTLMENEDLATRQGIDRSAYRTLETARQRIIEAINASRGDQAYDAARATYGRLSEDMVEPAQQALAPLMRINPQQGTMLTKAGRAVLDPGTRSPELVRAAREQFMNANQEGAWNSILRSFLQQEGVNALKTTARGEVRNVGGKLGKAFQDEVELPNLQAAMSPEQFTQFRDLLNIFRATGRAVDDNSDTAFKLAMQELAKRRDMGAVAKTLEIAMPFDKMRAARDFFANRSIDRQAQAMANIIASGDRAAIGRLRSLRQYDQSDWRYWATLGDILVRSGQIALDEPQ